MASFLLPVAAASFGAGILAVGLRGNGPLGAALLGGAAALLVLRVALGPSHEPAPRLPEGARVRGPPDPPDARERVLAAAGLPVGAGSPPRRRTGPWGVIAVAVAFAVAGAGWQLVRRAAALGPGELDGRVVAFRAVATSDLRTFEFGWGAEATLEEVELSGVGRETSLRVWIRGSDRSARFDAGVALEGSGRLEALEPGSSGFEDFLIGRGLKATLSVREVTAGERAGSMPLRLANLARSGLRTGAFRTLPDREAGLLLGLSIGDVREMDPEVEEDFRATGLAHLLAVSGSNVALFLAPVMAMAGALRLGRTTRAAVGITALAFFTLLTRWEPSVLRAGAMAVLALAAVWAGRPRSTAGALSVAVLLLLLADPGLASSLGFQLSVAATAGLAAVAGPLAARMRWLPRPVAVATAATIAAQLAVSPLLLLHFGVVPTVTLAANVLAAPAVAPALCAGLVGAGAGLAWPSLAPVMEPVARVPLAYLAEVADRLARFPLPSVAGRGMALPLVAAVVAVFLAWRIRRGRRGGRIVAAAAVVAVVAWTAGLGGGAARAFTVTFLDVGQGDAAVVRTPEGATVLIDAGPEEDEVAVDLARLGVRRIDLAVATHAHADHVDGFPAVLARFAVSLLLEPGCPGESPSYRRFLRAAEDEDVPVRHPRGGQTLTIGSLLVEVLGPDGCSRDSPNDDSVVLRLSYEGATVLFPGDAEVPAQQDLLDDGDPVGAEVLKVPHHGGDTSWEPFFDAVGARVAVVSTGPNDYGHPVPSVLAALRAAGMRVLRTDLAGDITVRFAPDGLLVESATT
ncbi:MAG: ComEC/Rec2 family competence protein [Actinomycetota bacterium]